MHKTIVAVRCPQIFERLLDSEKETEVHVEGFSSKVFFALMQLLYTDRVQIAPEINRGFRMLAMHYKLARIQHICGWSEDVSQGQLSNNDVFYDPLINYHLSPALDKEEEERRKKEANSLSLDMRTLLQLGHTNGDICFLLENGTVKTFRAILCARSEYFRGTFSPFWFFRVADIGAPIKKS